MHRETVNEQTVAKAVTLAKAEGRRVVVRDTLKAFSLRVTPSGAVSFAFQYRDGDGHQRLYTLPEAECSTPLQARAYVENLREQVGTGFDPLRNRRSDARNSKSSRKKVTPSHNSLTPGSRHGRTSGRCGWIAL
jgi:hypothetical protein